MPVRGLEYLITLNDQISKPLKAIKGELDRIGNAGKDAMVKIGVGAAGIAATGAALYNALQPAVEMSRALGEVKALGVTADGLDMLKTKALEFSSEYGLAAADFVSSSYDIQSAISGLTAQELASFTESANLIGKATKSSASAMTSYMGTMYGIFEKDALKLGKANWVEKIAGQTTYTANMFKSSGESMSQAFTALGANAQAAGIDVAEQMAILGSLQATMSGSESGTKYKAFLGGVGKAQKALGLTFTDSQGRMLDMVSILQKIKGKYGDVLDVAESDALKKAFGTDEAVSLIKLLLPKTKDLGDSIKEIAAIDGLDDVKRMAKDTTDPFMQLSQIIKNISISIGSQILKKITPFLQKIADMGAGFVKWLETYKNIARWLGYIVGGIIALTAVIPLVLLFVGLFKLWGLAIMAIKLPLLGLGGASKVVFPSILGFLTRLAKLGSPISLMFTGLKRVVFSLLSPFKALWGVGKGTLLFFKSGFATAVSGIKGFLFAFKLSPVLALKSIWGSLVSSVLSGLKLLLSPFSLWIALFAGVALFVYEFRAELSAFFSGVLKGFSDWGISFEPIKNGFSRIWEAVLRIVNVFRNLFGETQASEQSLASWATVGETVGAGLAWTFQTVLDAVGLVADLIAQVASIFEDVAVIIIHAWQDVLNAWGNNDIWGVFNAIGTGISNIFTRVLHGVKNMFFTFLNWLIDKINGLGEYIGITLPKIAIEEMPQPQEMKQITSATAGAANMALQMANSVGTQQLAPKPDANGQVFSLGSAQPPKLEKSPQISKTMQTTQNNQRYITIHKVEVNDGADLKRELQEGKMLNAG